MCYSSQHLIHQHNLGFLHFTPESVVQVDQPLLHHGTGDCFPSAKSALSCVCECICACVTSVCMHVSVCEVIYFACIFEYEYM